MPLIPGAVVQDEPSEWEKAELDQAQVEQRIKEYNSQINSNLFMSLVRGWLRARGGHGTLPWPRSPPPTGVFQNKDGSYTGFIKVQLKLVRPVSVPATKRVPSLHAGRPGPRAQGVKRRTSFYLPKGTVKHLHILSHTRASEVIDALLRKFTVVDNPRKFALFERSEKDEQGSAPGWPCPHNGGCVPVVAASPGWGRPHGGNVSGVVVSPWWSCPLWWQHPPGGGVPYSSGWCPLWWQHTHDHGVPRGCRWCTLWWWQHSHGNSIPHGDGVPHSGSIPVAVVSPMAVVSSLAVMSP